MKAIAIITARGGSKRIPKKNLRDFCGKPIIAYSIEAAIESEMFEEVMVSTDSVEIASIAEEYGAKVPFLRSAETSDDFATTSDVIKEVLSRYEQFSQKFDLFCCIYPTAPFVTAGKLKNAIAKINSSDATALIPVVQFSFPPQRAMIIENEKIRYMYPEFERIRSQDLQPIYHDCGQFYICKVDAFKESGSIITKKTIAFIMPEEEVQDIDNISDWILAEEKYRLFFDRNKK
ncbi:MAG: pseudaminic acid cytidylyltransferase [Hungatella sp.]|jgi:pseudaminic acid cytidylyltransferase|nr:pseudaminic acid cytidylyltransferase [Hungatella sp.]